MSETKIEILTQVYYGKGNPTIYFLKGLPASGKSSWAKKTANDKTLRFNKDDYRAMLTAPWSNNIEKNVVLPTLQSSGIAALENGFNIIIDDTNFSHSHFEFWKNVSDEGEYDFVEMFFNTPVDVCVERDSTRGDKSVGSKVINDMFHKHINVNNDLSTIVEYRRQDKTLPKAIIVDIDGTIAFTTGRNPYDNSKVHTDVPNQPIVDIVELAWLHGYELLIVTGREGTDDCKSKTIEWLDLQLPMKYKLFMRPAGDYRKDSTIKREIFEKEIEGKYNIQFVLDDRDQVVELWRKDLKLPCLQVNYGNF